MLRTPPLSGGFFPFVLVAKGLVPSFVILSAAKNLKIPRQARDDKSLILLDGD